MFYSKICAVNDEQQNICHRFTEKLFLDAGRLERLDCTVIHTNIRFIIFFKLSDKYACFVPTKFNTIRPFF